MDQFGKEWSIEYGVRFSGEIWLISFQNDMLKLFILNKTDVVESVSHILFVLFSCF